MWKFSVAILLLAVHLTLANLAAESTVTSAKLINSAPPPPPPPPPATSLGSLYRSARDDYNSRRHCANCGPGYERDMRSYGRQTGVTGYYSGMGPIEDDRNWYYRPESFDDRYRGGVMQSSYSGTYRQPPYNMGYDYDRYMSRPDDRGYGYGYPGMAMRTSYYDGGASRMPYYADMMRGYGYRGNGYDNLDPQYAYYMMQRGNPNGMNNRDRFYGSQGYYDDRMSYGGQYDQKNFRPWDQTYSRPLSSSSSSLSSPSSSLSAHASYHVQSHPAPEAGYGGHTPGGHDQHSSGHLSASYRPGANQPQQRPQHNGSDRPDYSPSDATSNCCRNRHPDTASNAYPNQGGSYSAHNTGRPSALSYGGGDSAHRPSGSWNYVNSGTTTGTGDSNYGTNTGHVGVSINTHGSYGEPHGGPGQYPGGGGGGSGSGNAHEYVANRGSDHRRESENRQQSFAYGGRPRPASVGDTSYLMDRDDNHNNRVSTDQDSARPTNDDSDKRAKSDIESFTSEQSQEKDGNNAGSVQSQTPKTTPDT
uniref:Uncharacterized protein n=1 Tax=Anopheles minimus TaxID=112268 RepID=A0A182WIZ9_9DIPT